MVLENLHRELRLQYLYALHLRAFAVLNCSWFPPFCPGQRLRLPLFLRIRNLMLQNACAEISRPLQGISPIRIRSRSAPSVLNISKIILAQFPVRVQCFPLKTPIVHEHVTSHQPPLQVVVCSGPPRGLCCLLASKAGAASSVTGYRYKAAPSLSSFLDSSDCSLTYFLIASSVTLPIVAT